MFKGRNLLLIIVGALAMLYYSLVTYVVPNYIKQLLPTVETMAQDYVNGSVRIGGLSWGGGFSAQVDDVVVEDAQQKKVAVLPKTVVHFRPWLILGGVEKVVTKIELQQPQAFLVMDEEQNWNMQSLLKPSDSEETPFYGLLQITDGDLQVQLPNAKWSLLLNGSVDGGANPNFAVDADVAAGSDRLRLQGIITTKGLGALTLKTDSLDIAPYSPAIEYLEQVYDNSGKLTDLRLHWSNNGKRVQVDGEGKLAGVAGRLKLENAMYDFQVDGAISAINNVIKLQPLDIALNGQNLRLEATADLADMNDLQAIKATGRLKYGEGEVAFNGSYSEAVAAYLADASFRNIRIALPDGGEDAVTINGDVAVLAKAQENSLDVQAAADAFDLRWRSLQVHKVGFDGSVDKQGLSINHFSIMAGKSGSLIANGAVGSDGSLQLSGRMAEFPIDPFLDVAGQQGSGICSTGFNIGGTLGAPKFAGIVQLSDIDFMQQKVDEAHGFVAVEDNLITIKNFVANMQQGKHVLNGKVNLQGAEPVVDLSLETYGVRAEPLIALAAPDVKLTGNVDNVVQVQGSLSNPSVSGEVCLTDGSAQGYLLDKVQGRYAYREGQLDLRSFTIDALSAEVFLDGTLSKNQDLDFTMKARNVSLERLPIMASDVDLQGFINLNGALTGTLTYPRFTGDVSSDYITVNGEALSELSGSLDANGRDVNTLNVRFKQPYVDDSSNYGLFTADLNLDLVNKYMQGKVLTLWGNLGGILRMAKQDYAIDGTAQGELDFNPRGKGSGVDIEISVDDVKIHDLDYYRMLFKGKLLRGVLTMDDVRLQEQQGIEDKGIITLGGAVDLIGKKLDLTMTALQANPAVVTALMSDPPPITGRMDLQLAVNGTFEDPSGRVNVEIADGSISGVSMDSLKAQAILADDNIKLESFSVMKDIYGMRAAGDIPVDLLRSSEERRNPNAQMKIAIDLEDARLGMLPAMTKLVEWGVGETEGKLSLEGTLEEPLVYGSIKIAEGSVKLRDMATVIDKIHTDIEFKGNELLLNDLSAQLGKGSIVASGNYALRADDAEPYSLHVSAQDADLSSEIFTGIINSDVVIMPQKYRDRAKRQGNRPAPTAYRPLIKGSVKLEDVLVNMPTIPEMGEGGSNLGLDMQIELGKKIHFFNKYLYDMWLSGRMHIKGSTLYPMVDGQIKVDRGSVTYLRTPFKLKNTSVNWIEPGTFLPNVNLESEARFSRYDIYMRINGPLEEMNLQLSSNPPLEKNTIVRMLTLQRDSAGSDDVSSEDMANLMTAGLQMTVLGDVEMLVKQTLGLDQFRIYTGKVRSGIGFESVRDRNQELTPEERNQYNMLVSKYLGSKFMTGYTTSFDGIDRSIFGQYDINRHLNVTYSRSYDLSDEAEDWFGLEYKVSFN